VNSKPASIRQPDPNETEVVEQIQAALGTKVTIRRTSGDAGRIEIDFYSDEELERLADLLGSLERAR